MYGNFTERYENQEATECVEFKWNKNVRWFMFVKGKK